MIPFLNEERESMKKNMQKDGERLQRKCWNAIRKPI